MLTERHKHDAVLLEDGKVLVVGGADERDDGGQYSSAEIYDPHTGMFTMDGNMNASRYKFQGTSILLRTGKVLLIGGASVTEIYDPVTNTFNEVIDGLGTTRLFATATSLPSELGSERATRRLMPPPGPSEPAPPLALMTAASNITGSFPPCPAMELIAGPVTAVRIPAIATVVMTSESEIMPVGSTNEIGFPFAYRYLRSVIG